MTKETSSTEAVPRISTLDDTIQHWVIWLMRLSLVAAAIFSAFTTNWETAFISVLALVLTGLPRLIRGRYHLSMPIEYDFVIVLFIYAGIFLGEVGGAYEHFWWWDKVLHLSSGVVLAFVGFLALHSLYYQKKVTASPLLLSLFVFSFGLAAGALWEIFEYGMDNVFGLNMQRDSLQDTMTDLIVDAVGALFVARLAYSYFKRGHGGPLSRLVKNFMRHNPQLITSRKRAEK